MSMAEPVTQCLAWKDLVNAKKFASHYGNNMDSTVAISGWTHDEHGRLVRFGATGIMISKRRMITNHHVLPTPEVAEGKYDPSCAISTGAAFQFQNQYAPYPTVFPIKFQPQIFWYTNEELDCTIVAVDTDALAFVTPTCPPRRKIEEAEKPIYALSHPSDEQYPYGRPLQFSPSGKRVTGCEEYWKRVWYTSEIHPGSSGGGIYDTERGDLIVLVSHEIKSLKVNQGTNIKAIWRDVYDTKISNMPGDPMYDNLKIVRDQINAQDLEFQQLCPLEHEFDNRYNILRTNQGAIVISSITTSIITCAGIASGIIPATGLFTAVFVSVASAAGSYITRQTAVVEANKQKRLLQLTY